jgi:hypothetical protein
MKTFVREKVSGWRAAYVAAVIAAACGAQVTHDGRYYLAALVLTLPSGVGLIAGVYVAYGLVEQLVTFVQPGMSPDHVNSWVFALTAPINVALLAAAAIGNLALLRLFSDEMRARRRSGRVPRPSGSSGQ